jgi:hypothetical protein
MTGSRDKFDDDSDLDQLAHDLDLDMDAPIGATFAAALRGQDEKGSVFEEADFGLDDDGFMTPPSRLHETAPWRAVARGGPISRWRS